MPSQATIKKIGINPFAIAASQGKKRGTKEYEETVHAITRSALAKKRIGVKKGK